MRLTFLCALIAGVLLLFPSCLPSSPAEVAQAFLNAMSAKDFKAAQGYGDPELQITLQRIDSLMDYLQKDLKDRLTKESGKKVTVVSENLQGERATVAYVVEGEPGLQVLRLQKFQGAWKVNFTKDQAPATAAP